MARRGNGEGCIRQRSDGRWEAKYVAGIKSDGSLIRNSIYGKTQSEVSKKLLEIRKQLETGQYAQPDKITVAKWLDTWLEEYVKPTRRPATVATYANNIRIHLKPAFGRTALQKLRPENVQRLYNDMSKGGAKPATVIKAHHVLNAAMKQAIKNRLIINNPCEAVALPKLEQEDINPLSRDEQRRFVEALPDTTNGRALTFILGTGLRVSELCGLRWKDVTEGTISITQSIRRLQTTKNTKGPKTEIVTTKPKTKAGMRKIPLSTKLSAILAKERQAQAEILLKLGASRGENDLVFATALGKPLDVRNISRALYNTLDKLGIERRGVHALRHTFATRAIENGMDVRTLSEILGHADVAVTLRLYVHSSMETKQKSMDMMDNLL